MQEKKIIVYGNRYSPQSGIRDISGFGQFIAQEIFTKNHCRYRSSLKKNADVIVLTWEGLVCGHFIVDHEEKPTAEDRQAHPKTNKTYIITKSLTYEAPQKIRKYGITGIHFGKQISERTFIWIVNTVGTLHRHKP